MTLVMGDSITAGHIPGWVQVEAGYVDGKFQSYYGLNPRKKRLSITAIGLKPADAGDFERGDLKLATAPRILAKGSWCIYTSVANVSRLLQIVPRTRFKLWTAHYGIGAHICNPLCYPGMPTWADGTQWIDHTNRWDESLLQDNFFSQWAPPPVINVKETSMIASPVVENGRAYFPATGTDPQNNQHLFWCSCDLDGKNPSFIDLTDEVPGGQYTF